MTTMTTTTMTWKAGRLVCRAPHLLRFGGCRCPAEGPGRHPVADLGRGRPVAVAHHGCSVWRSSNVFRQHQVFKIPVKQFDIWHLEFDERERNHWYKSTLLKLPRMKASPWTCCVPQPAGSAATSKITWWRPDFYPSGKKSVFVVIWLIGSTKLMKLVAFDGRTVAFCRCAPIWMVSILEPRVVV